MRESLMDAIERVKKGDLLASDANAIANLAGRISQSLQVEAALREADASLVRLPIGAMPIGEDVINMANNPRQLADQNGQK